MQNLILLLISCICLVALFLVLGLLFPDRIEKSRWAAEGFPRRSFLIGLVNTLFLSAIIFGIIALAEAINLELITIIAVFLMVFYVIIFVFGLTSMVHIVGTLFAPMQHQKYQVGFGAVILLLACLTPFIGWFLLFPYIGITGVGAVIIGSFGGKHKSSLDSEH